MNQSNICNRDGCDCQQLVKQITKSECLVELPGALGKETTASII
jgi:hypothetical protein